MRSGFVMTDSLRVAFIGDRDYANCAHRAAQAINTAAGFAAARVVVAQRHQFGYPTDICVEDIGRDAARGALVEHMRGGDPAWVFTTGTGSAGRWAEWGARAALPSGAKMRLGALHIGSAYRKDPESFNEADRARGVSLRFISADSMRFSDSDHDHPYAHSISSIPRPTIEAPEIPVVVHSPSVRHKKGSDEIESVLADLKASGLLFESMIVEGVSYEECLGRRGRGHILIGQLNLEVGGFGYSSVEAAAQGLAPMATINNIAPDMWADAGLPRPPVIGITSEEDLSLKLRALIENPALLQEARARCVEWTHDGAVSPERAGAYYIKRLMEH